MHPSHHIPPHRSRSASALNEDREYCYLAWSQRLDLAANGLRSSQRAVRSAALLAVLLACVCTGCSSKVAPAPVPPEIGPALTRSTAEDVHVPLVHFHDVTSQAGIHFHHTNGAFGKRLLPETMGSGVAFLDYDKDGRQDILFVNSCFWPGHVQPKGPTLALYRNLGQGKFADVTAEAGLGFSMYGMGVTVGDYDNDGWIDIFVTGVGGNRLLRNVAAEGGGRRFVDATESAGVKGPGGWPEGGDILTVTAPVNFSTSAAFLDYDGDGRLDLFVCNYVRWSPRIDLSNPSTLDGLERAYGPPTDFEGTQCFLYRNLGEGRFEDVSAQAGIHVTDQRGASLAKSLGVIVCDVDDDGWPDIVVANDTVPNFFFHNKGGTFEEVGSQAGVAEAEGRARGAMGIDWGEYRPGKPALLIGNFAEEPDTFLRLDNPTRLWFSDAAIAEGLHAPSRLPLKFGVFFFDYDLDGRMDLLTCNGHLEPEIQRVKPGQTYKQPVQLFWNTGSKPGFEPVGAAQAGPDLFRPMIGRGCAFGDIDADGNLDIVLTQNGGPARLLRNEGGTGNHWLRLILEGDGKRSNKSAIGARVTVECGDLIQHRQVASARGYLSQSELPLTFGLGKATRVDRVSIQWPGKEGGTQEFTNLAIDSSYDVIHAQRVVKKR